MKPPIGRDTRLCMSLAARPGNFGSRFHNRLYELLGLDYVYKACATDDLPGAIGGIRALGIRGCAVSMPFKEAVIPMLDALDPSARAIDSVNTIVNDVGSGASGKGTAVRLLLESHDVDPAMPFMLRGSGGMAKAVATALRDAGFVTGTIVARNEARGRVLAEAHGYRWISEPDATGAPLLVNVTPLGMAGPDADVLAFAEPLIARCEVAFDIVALPAETPFLAAARANGKRVVTGTEVATLQALEQFVLYTGIRPDQSDVEAAAGFARA
jgi:shikimate dehydrogenase